MELNVEPIVLKDGASESTARIAAHLGFNCYSFLADVEGRNVDVVYAADGFLAGDKPPSHHGIPILFPFPNRIRGGKYHWEGRDYEIPPSSAAYDPTGNAIHGFCLDRPWRVTDQGEDFAVGEFRLSIDAPDRLPLWPGDCLIEVRYKLNGSRLRADVRIANTSETAIPWGFGTHPYFRVPLDAASAPSDCLVQAPGAEELELVDCLPTGRRIPIRREKDLRDGAYFDQLAMDDILTGLDVPGDVVECLIMDERAGLQVAQRTPVVFRELVVYTPPHRQAVCLEPYTCITDAINMQPQGVDAGLRTLPPGGEFRTWIEIEAGLVVA